MSNLQRTLEQMFYSYSKQGKVLFTSHDVALLVPQKTSAAKKMLLNRLSKNGILLRLTKGLYLYNRAELSTQDILFQCAAYLRRRYISYLSQESILSEHGIISQIPMNYITMMTNGRSGIFRIAHHGTIEFTHLKRNIADILPQLDVDGDYHCLRAPVQLAYQDLKLARRNLDLIDIEELNEHLS